MRHPITSLVLRLIASQALVLTLTVSLPWVVLVLYPGSLRPTAVVLCPDDKTDAYVVQYSEQTSEGTGTNWTLFCMDEQGEVEEVGSWAPLGIYLLGWLLLFEVLVLPIVIVGWVRGLRRPRGPSGRRRRRHGGAPAGPYPYEPPAFSPPPISPPPFGPPQGQNPLG